VVEHLPSKWKTLSSNHSTQEGNKEKEEEILFLMLGNNFVNLERKLTIVKEKKKTQSKI
jgi:hypothetical protein